jgi:exonuclease-1
MQRSVGRKGCSKGGGALLSPQGWSSKNARSKAEGSRDLDLDLLNQTQPGGFFSLDSFLLEALVWKKAQAKNKTPRPNLSTAAMGIKGLLPALRQVTRPAHVSTWAGCCVGIDTYGWIHRSKYTCARDLALGVPTTRWIDWCERRCRMLQAHRVTPVCVFDGASPVGKAGVEQQRAYMRATHRSQAVACLEAGDRAGAERHFSCAVDVSPEMADQLVRRLRTNLGIECIVAPFEADAQLAHLSRLDRIQVVVSEDSDMLAFGCKRVLYKMNDTGHGEQVALTDVLAHTTLSHEHFQQACILAGCDYLSSVRGIGIKRAMQLMVIHRDWRRALDSLGDRVPPSYRCDFERALRLFLHQGVAP